MQTEFDQTRENRAHAYTFDKFTVLVSMGAMHVTILLSALALAFVAKLPLAALAWGVGAHLVLAIVIMRAWEKPLPSSLPGVMPGTPHRPKSAASVHTLQPPSRRPPASAV